MRNQALLVIDYIKGIAAGNGSCAGYLRDYPEVIDNTNTLISAARIHEISVFHIRLAFDANYTGLPKHAPLANLIRNDQHFQLDSEATEFIAEIQQNPTDVIINKSYGDVFQGNHLIQHLQDQDLEEIIFTGVSTDNAVLNSTNTAILNDFYVTVIHDACGAPTKAAHENALNMMQGRTASEITTTAAFLEKLSKPKI